MDNQRDVVLVHFFRGTSHTTCLIILSASRLFLFCLYATIGNLRDLQESRFMSFVRNCFKQIVISLRKRGGSKCR